MKDQKECKCGYEFQPKANEYSIALIEDGKVMITLTCPSCNEDIEFSIIHNDQWLTVD